MLKCKKGSVPGKLFAAKRGMETQTQLIPKKRNYLSAQLFKNAKRTLCVLLNYPTQIILHWKLEIDGSQTLLEQKVSMPREDEWTDIND